MVSNPSGLSGEIAETYFNRVSSWRAEPAASPGCQRYVGNFPSGGHVTLLHFTKAQDRGTAYLIGVVDAKGELTHLKTEKLIMEKVWLQNYLKKLN